VKKSDQAGFARRVELSPTAPKAGPGSIGEEIDPVSHVPYPLPQVPECRARFELVRKFLFVRRQPWTNQVSMSE